MKKEIYQILRESLKSGIIGIGISIIFFFTYVGLNEEGGILVLFLTFLIYLVFGYVVGFMIPVAIRIVYLLSSKIFPKIGANIVVELLLTFFVSSVVFYCCMYLFTLILSIFFDIVMQETIYINISLGVGFASVMINLFYSYYDQLEEKMKLEKENRKLAVIEERNRIARELHDSVSQNLFGISLNLNTLPAIIESDKTRAVEMTEQLQEMVQEVQTEMRLMIYELRPMNFKDKDFYESLESMISLFRKRYKLNIVYSSSGEEVNLEENKQLVLFRILQESLNNIVKHAKASKVKVFIKIKNNNAELIVEDDGKGFDTSQKISVGHYGIKGMKERLEKIGGALKLVSNIDEGTKVIAHV
ncbi:MAG: sensor histidine kinase [Halanaerobiales bacterium]